MTLLELEGQIARQEAAVTGAQTAVMIQCVGCRQTDRNYCARVCCTQAVKNALKLKNANPQMDVYIIYRDMRTYGFREDYYREAADREVSSSATSRMTNRRWRSLKRVGSASSGSPCADPILGKNIAIDADMLALAAAVIPPAANAENLPAVQGPPEPGRLLSGSPRQTASR